MGRYSRGHVYEDAWFIQSHGIRTIESFLYIQKGGAIYQGSNYIIIYNMDKTKTYILNLISIIPIVIQIFFK